MTLTEAGAALGEALYLTSSADPLCSYVLPTKIPGVRIMIEKDTVVRVDVDTNLVATDSGARVGDTEKALQEHYRPRLRVQRHKYLPQGHYLIFQPPNDSLHRVVFETDGQRVTGLHSGRQPAVDYVEGCA